jgi:hypothetical protein
MKTPASTDWLSALAPTRAALGRDESLTVPGRDSVALQLTLDRSSGRVLVERGSERIELAGLGELTRYLESLALETPAGTPRGLR